jgi:hypothetical protein
MLVAAVVARLVAFLAVLVVLVVAEIRVQALRQVLTAQQIWVAVAVAVVQQITAQHKRSLVVQVGRVL